MKRYIAYLVAFALGVLLTSLICRKYHFGRDLDIVERIDTVEVHDTIRYGFDELKTIEVPVTKTEYIKIPEVMIEREVVHDTIFVVLKRQQYYTERDGLHIWHSGIKSRIDSVDFVERKYVIEKVRQEKTKKNAINLGVEAGYYGTLIAPAYLEYERRFKPWVSVYGRVGYNFPTQEYGVGIGAKLSLHW